MSHSSREWKLEVKVLPGPFAIPFADALEASVPGFQQFLGFCGMAPVFIGDIPV